MKPRIAVIGAGGFVGGRFVEMAALGGAVEAVPVVRSLSGAARLARFGVTCHLADATNTADVVAAIRDCDVVVNLTAGDSRRIVEQVRSIHSACLTSGTRTLVHLSSTVVLQDATSADRTAHAAPIAGQRNQYAREKARAERWLEGQVHGATTVVTLRPGLIWGPRSPWVTGPLSALANGTAFLAVGGSGACNLIYVDNLIHSILAVAHHPTPRSGFYNVADDRLVTWREYYAALGAIVGCDIDRIVDIGDVAPPRDLGAIVDRLKETWWFDWLKRTLSSRIKVRMKEVFQDARTGLSRTSDPDRHVTGPVVTPEMWTLQRTLHAPSTAAFRDAFGTCNRVPFDEALKRTAEWAGFAGFALPVGSNDEIRTPSCGVSSASASRT